MAYLANWSYRKAIVVAHTDDGAQANYQLKLLVGESSGATGEQVDCGGKVASDFDDLRFTADDGTTLLDYWIESITGASPNGLATVWVEVPSIAAHPDDTTIYMYYGGTETAVTSGANTFIVFDNFERGNDGDTVGGDWTEISAHVHISTEQDIGDVAGYTGTRSAKFIGSDPSPQATIPVTFSAKNAIRFRYYKETAPVIYFYHQAGAGSYLRITQFDAAEDIFVYDGASYVDTTLNCLADTWGYCEIYNFAANTIDLNVDENVKTGCDITNTFDYAINVFKVLGDLVATRDTWIDDFIVRNWTANEPTWGSFGGEEVVVTPDTLKLTLTTYALDVGIDFVVTPSTLALTLITYALEVYVINGSTFPYKFPITFQLDNCEVRIGFDSDPMDATQTWTDVSRDVQTISINRGRQHELDRFEAGEAIIVLRDTSYWFWPDNTQGAYYDNVKIGKAVNINRTHEGVLYHLYTGYITSITPGWTGQPNIGPNVTIRCGDFINNLSHTLLNDASGYDQELSGTRVGNVLSDASFPSGDIDADVGQENMISSGALANVNAQTHLLSVMESEIGAFYMAADGDAQFEDRSHRNASPHDTAQSIFGDDSGEMQYTDVSFTMDNKFLYNEIRLNRSGGTEQTASDATSQTTYGTRTLSKTGLLLTSDVIVDIYCDFYLSRYKDQGNVMRLRSIIINPQSDPDNLWPKVLGYEISTRITIRLNSGYVDGDYFIEGIQHTYDNQTKLWTTKWMLSDATSYYPAQSPLEETIRPNAAGDSTQCLAVGTSPNWECVNDSTADDATTYVRGQNETGTVAWYKDLYNMGVTNYSSGTINSVKFYTRYKHDNAPTYVPLIVKTNGTEYTPLGTKAAGLPTINWTTENYTYTTNPKTGLAWTWAEIAALQVGCTLGTGSISGYNYVTQQYAVVNYTPTW